MQKQQLYLSALALVLAVFREQAAEQVPAAAGHVDQGTLLPQAETWRHGQNQRHRLNQQSPLPQVTTDDEAAEDCFNLHRANTEKFKNTAASLLSCCFRSQRCFCHLWDSWAAGVRSKHSHQRHGQEGKEQSPQDVEEVIQHVRSPSLKRRETKQKEKHVKDD